MQVYMYMDIQANGNLGRFRLVDKALTEETEQRLAGEAKLRREVESMARAVALSIRDADAQHAALVEVCVCVCVCVCVFVCLCVCV